MRRLRFDFAPRTESKALLLETEAADTTAAPDIVLLPQEPPMSALDETIFLLQIAAEIEHSLLVEYLYAAYSLSAATEPAKSWRDIVIGIAREEMGHLLGVQNVLYALGGPLNFEREDYPYNSFYPFPFELEPFSLKSVAKYVLAEMPDISQIPGNIGFDLEQLKKDAVVTSPDQMINRVGLLYERLLELIKTLPESDFHSDSLSMQANLQEWSASGADLTVRAVKDRETAAALLEYIAVQGEGATEPVAGISSHFRRFFAIYQDVRRAGSGFIPADVPINPSTYDQTASGYLSNDKTRLWAHLLNLRYRILLTQLIHYIQLRSDLTPEKEFRSHLKVWCIEEMRFYLSGLASFLTELPQHEPPQEQGNRVRMAGAPFELPYSLVLPARNIDRWRYHKMMAEESLMLCDMISDGVSGQPFIRELRDWDAQRLAYIQKRIAEG